MTETMTEALTYMLDTVGAQNGQLVLARNDGKWVVGCFFGVEAPDSPMAGGAAHGLGPDLTEAVRQVAEQMGWKQAGDPSVAAASPVPADEPAAGLPRYLTTYDDYGRQTGRWQIHFDITDLAQAPIECTNAITEAALVVGWTKGKDRLLKSRYTSLNSNPEETLAALRAQAPPEDSPADLIDDDRPRVDGTPCPWRGKSDDYTGPGNNVRCALDTGHEGAHDPVPIDPAVDTTTQPHIPTQKEH